MSCQICVVRFYDACIRRPRALAAHTKGSVHLSMCQTINSGFCRPVGVRDIEGTMKAMYRRSLVADVTEIRASDAFSLGPVGGPRKSGAWRSGRAISLSEEHSTRTTSILPLLIMCKSLVSFSHLIETPSGFITLSANTSLPFAVLHFHLPPRGQDHLLPPPLQRLGSLRLVRTPSTLLLLSFLLLAQNWFLAFSAGRHPPLQPIATDQILL